jgi:prephenate dehydrogenase
MAEALANADLVILATPVRSILKLLGDIGPYLKEGTIVTDVGGTKEAICEAAKALPSGVSFIGGHPMAGSERHGPSAAQPMLFLDAVWAVCPLPTVPDDHLNRLKAAILQIGAHPLLIDAARHDRMAAAVSHVPYLVAASLSNSVGKLGEEDELALRLAGRGFRDVTRTASSPYHLWGDILSTNRKAVTERLAAFRQAVDRVGEALGSDEQALQAELEDAARYRLNVPRNLSGIHNPDSEIIVRVEDEVGALAAVTTALAQEKINVRDIQVLKVRQDTDGVLRLAFGDREETLHAAEVLRRAGHNVRLRTE